MSLKKTALLNSNPGLLKQENNLKSEDIDEGEYYKCKIYKCFYFTYNGLDRLKRHYKIYHDFSGKYGLNDFNINKSIWHINRKKGLYSTPNGLSTLPLCFLSPRGCRISIPK